MCNFRIFPKLLHFGKSRKKLVKFSKNSAKSSKNPANSGKFCNILQKSAKNSAIFNEKIEIRERCKGVHCVDLGESFPTRIYLQKSASIQPYGPRIGFDAGHVEPVRPLALGAGCAVAWPAAQATVRVPCPTLRRSSVVS